LNFSGYNNASDSNDAWGSQVSSSSNNNVNNPSVNIDNEWNAIPSSNTENNKSEWN